MTYSKKTLAIIGLQVVKQHPEIASKYLVAAKLRIGDLENIHLIFLHYCEKTGVIPDHFYGPVYCLEPVKVFVCALARVYDESQKGFGKKLSEVFGKQPACISRINQEVRARYGKDKDFTASVDRSVTVINQYKITSNASN